MHTCSCLHELLEHMRRSLKLISVAPSTYPSHPHRSVTAQGSNSSFHHCSACGVARSDYVMESGARLTPQRKALRGPLLHARTARRCVCARIRCLRLGGIAIGREACARSDLRRFRYFFSDLARPRRAATRPRAPRTTRSPHLARGSVLARTRSRSTLHRHGHMV